MRPVKALELDVVRTKADWRKKLADPNVSMEERRRARYAWRKAIAAKDRALMLLLKARSNRRDVGVDRRKAPGQAPQTPQGDRRKSARGRRDA